MESKKGKIIFLSAIAGFVLGLFIMYTLIYTGALPLPSDGVRNQVIALKNVQEHIR